MARIIFRIKGLCALLCWVLLAVNTKAAESGAPALAEFSFESLTGETYTNHSWDGKAVVVFLTSREAAVHNEGRVWTGPITEFIGTLPAAGDFALVKVLDLPGIPGLFRGIARDAVAEAAEGDPIRINLFDWEGGFAEHYGLPRDNYNVLVFDKTQQLAFSMSLRAFDQARLDDIFRKVEGLASAL